MTADFQFRCQACGVVKTYNLDPEKVRSWLAGALIQDLFPEIEDREIMISQTCGDCFDKLFAGMDD